MAGIFVLLFIISGLLFGAKQWMTDYSQKQKVTLAVALPQEGTAEKWMLSILKEMESIKENCILIEASEKDALEMLANGNAYGAIIIPKGFVNGIMTGENLPAEIYLPQSPLQKDLISLLADAGASSLSSAQAGIYAMSDFAYAHNMKRQLPKIQEDLNRDYIRFTLKRPNYFNHVVIQDAKQLPLDKQYIVSGACLFLLLCTVSMTNLFSNQSPALLAKLRIYGVSSACNNMVQTAVMFLLLTAIAMVVFIPFAILNTFDIFYLQGAIGIIVAVFSIAAMAIFIFTASRSLFSGMLFLFLISLAMLFASGGFLPSYLLPSGVSNIGNLLPTDSMMNSISNLFTGSYRGMIPCLLWGGIFAALSALLSATQHANAKGGSQN